ncbi:MAG: hypothetical protein HUJ66_00760 [Oscillospiraceae bacterium]|nr:hypothetical protein [Oscillospiraceae bacterium]
MKKLFTVALILILLLSVVPVGASADTADNWVCAWSTSPVEAGLNDIAVLDKLGIALSSVSSRVVVTPTASGSQLRLTFSNEFGTSPLSIGGCTVAATAANQRVLSMTTIKIVTFGGKNTVSIPAGGVVVSDPVKFDVTAGQRLSVTTYFPCFNTQRTIGLIGGNTYAAVGNYTRVGSMLLGIPLELSADSGDYQVIPSLKSIDVLSSDPDACSCVIFGDSTVANEIPRMLETKLRANGVTNVSVTQQAIKGNRLVADGIGTAGKVLGEAGLDRFQRDVLDQAGVKYVIVKLGINDIVHPHCASMADKLTPVTFEEMVEGYTQLVEMAHAQGVKIYFAELTPWKGYTRNVLGAGDDVQWTPEIDALRQQLNAWFASDDCPADGAVFFPSMADPADIYALNPAFTPDGIHFNADGQQAFVNDFPVDIFA